MTNFNREVQALKGRTHRGMIEAIIVLQDDAEKMTPFDLGNLRSSWFTVSYKSNRNLIPVPDKFKGKQSGVMQANHDNTIQAFQSMAKQIGSKENLLFIFGYSANYAAFVHENVDATFSRPNSRARWLYIAIQNSQAKMLQKIQEHSRIR